MRLTEFDAIELMASILGKEDYTEESEIIDEFEDFYGISLESFRALATVLIKMTAPVESPLSGKKYHAFINGQFAVAKLEVEEDE